jgi:hypothetical protein
MSCSFFFVVYRGRVLGVLFTLNLKYLFLDSCSVQCSWRRHVNQRRTRIRQKRTGERAYQYQWLLRRTSSGDGSSNGSGSNGFLSSCKRVSRFDGGTSSGAGCTYCCGGTGLVHLILMLISSALGLLALSPLSLQSTAGASLSRL